MKKGVFHKRLGSTSVAVDLCAIVQVRFGCCACARTTHTGRGLGGQAHRPCPSSQKGRELRAAAVLRCACGWVSWVGAGAD